MPTSPPIDTPSKKPRSTNGVSISAGLTVGAALLFIVAMRRKLGRFTF